MFSVYQSSHYDYHAAVRVNETDTFADEEGLNDEYFDFEDISGTTSMSSVAVEIYCSSQPVRILMWRYMMSLYLNNAAFLQRSSSVSWRCRWCCVVLDTPEVVSRMLICVLLPVRSVIRFQFRQDSHGTSCCIFCIRQLPPLEATVLSSTTANRN